MEKDAYRKGDLWAKGSVEKMCLDGFLEYGEWGGFSDAFGEFVPEGGSTDGKSSVTPGPVFGPDGATTCISRAEGAGGSVPVEKFSQVRGSQVTESFVGHQEEYVLDLQGNAI